MASYYYNSTGMAYYMFRDLLINHNGTAHFHSLTVAQHGQALVINNGLVKSGVLSTAIMAKLQQVRQAITNGTLTLPKVAGQPFPPSS